MTLNKLHIFLTALLIGLCITAAPACDAEARQRIGVITEGSVQPGQTFYSDTGINDWYIPVEAQNRLNARQFPGSHRLYLASPNRFLKLGELQQLIRTGNLIPGSGNTSQDSLSSTPTRYYELWASSHLSESMLPDIPLSEDSLSGNRLFFRKGPYLYHSDQPASAFAEFFEDEEFTTDDLNRLDRQIQSMQAGQLLFISSEWLNTAAQAYPELANSIRYLHEQNSWVFPVPAPPEPGWPFNWTVFLLMLMWLTTAIILHFVPSYRLYISRYFLAHSFHAEDILQYRERSSVFGLATVIHHSVFTGLVFYMLASSGFGRYGTEAFFHHYPLLAIGGVQPFSFFLIGMIIALLFQFIALIWLKFTGDVLPHFSQALNLYTGIFHLDFILVTIMLVLFLTGSSAIYLLIPALIFLFFWFMAFNIAAFDASQVLLKDRGKYLFYTIGLHTLLSAIALTVLLLFTELPEVIALAIYL